MVIDVLTSDSIIWNESTITIDMCKAMSSNESIVIDLNNEGPSLIDTGLYDIIEQCASTFTYNLNNVTVLTCNRLEQHKKINVTYNPPIQFVHSTVNSLQECNITKNKELNYFGMFVGRSNAPRLSLATYLSFLTVNCTQSYHYDQENNFHLSNIGLEELINKFGKKYINAESQFLSTCPRFLDDKPTYPILMKHHNDIYPHYANFFVEIVCETYYSGNTFFPTEKIWRPIMLKTPFIVHGPQWFLKNLKALGFETFNRWWDEGYSEDPCNHSVLEILRVIDKLVKKTPSEIMQLYNEMSDVLDHNYNTLVSLTADQIINAEVYYE